MTKEFKGKAIYNPSGKAGEYSYWACNFYVGCSNGCEYCYCKKGILATAMGQDMPQLKKCFKNETDALQIFIKELDKNIDELKNNGLFFSFTTDPLLPETEMLTFWAVGYAVNQGVPVKLLTKCTGWVDEFLKIDFTGSKLKKMYAFGFSLTGHDELEPNASTNQGRIEAMRKLHNAGFKTFASIEPIIDFKAAIWMIYDSRYFCDLFKIGLMSGTKHSSWEIKDFMVSVYALTSNNKIYFKDSLLKAAGIARGELPANCVSRDYNFFNQ